MKKRLVLTIVATVALLLTQPMTHVSAATSSTSEAPWWDESWHYRAPYTLHSGNYNRIDVPIELTVNFTSLLIRFSAFGSFDENSVRVIEYSTADKLLLEVPSQFDKAPDYNATFNAVGTVTWIMNGTTPPDTIRKYHVYFDTLENDPKTPPNYSGVSYKVSGNYVLLQNEKINLTIRYRMYGTYLEELYFDKNGNGNFESNEEMIGKNSLHRLGVAVTDEEKTEHGWIGAGFFSNYNDDSTLTILRNGPIVTELKFSNVSLLNTEKERKSLAIETELIYKIYKLSSLVYVKTIMNVNEDLDIKGAYEEIFLDHKELYDTWYIDEDYNGNFISDWSLIPSDIPNKWFFSGNPAYGFFSSYNSSGNGGIAFIPNMSHYSKVTFGEYRYAGPAMRFPVSTGTWPTGKRIELENKLFAHLGDWSNVKEEVENINKPPKVVSKLSIHLVDSNNVNLNSAEIKIYDSIGNLVRVGSTNSTGWLTFMIGWGNYTIRPFWMGLQVASRTLSISSDVTIDPLKCDVYSLDVHSFSVDETPKDGVMVGVYLINGTRISRSITNSNGSAFFKQLPSGDFLVKTYYLDRQFGADKPIELRNENVECTVYEAPGLGPPQQIRYDIVYALIVMSIACIAAVMILQKGYPRIKLGLLLSILVLVVFLAGAYTQNSFSVHSSVVHGISATYNSETGLVMVGDQVRIAWKDFDRDGSLDDWNLFIISSNGTELVKIDLGASLSTPTGVYSLYEAETKGVFYFDMAANDYSPWKPTLQEPNFADNADDQPALKLKFNFLKPSRWEINLFCWLEQGKPHVQLAWEIVEKGDGAGIYSLFPQFITTFPFDRLVLPANYTSHKLWYWNQHYGPTYANPWIGESDWGVFGAYVGNMHVSDQNVVLHMSPNYGTAVKVHSSSAFARHSNWIHNLGAAPPYFQYDFWVDWDGTAPPSSDIKIEVWVPDILDLTSTEILYSLDGTNWLKNEGWTLTEGNRGDPGFSSYKGCKHRLLVTFPANSLTADDGSDNGTDYGDPRIGNDEYLVRLKVAYLNEGLTTYEFEDSSNLWYGLQNTNDAWLWLMASKKSSLSIGIVPTRRFEYLAVQVDHSQKYHNVTMGVRESLTNNGNASFFTNIVMFSTSEATRGDIDSDGIINMFDDPQSQLLLISAISVSKESLSQIDYERRGFNEMAQYSYWFFSKKLLMNDWNASPQYTICLPKEVSRHIESDGAVFKFERYGYYVYEISQSDEIRWKEKTLSVQPVYQLYAMVGLISIGLVLSTRCRDALKKHWVIVVLFILCFSLRFYFQSFTVRFPGTDAVIRSNIAKNVVNYGKFQVNYFGIEPHWIEAGAFFYGPPTHPVGSVTSWFNHGVAALSFVILGQSIFAIKSIDVLLGSLLVFPTYYLAKKLFDEKTATLTALIVAFHPLLIYYSGVHPSVNIVPALVVMTTLCLMAYGSKKAAVGVGFLSVFLFIMRFEYAFIMVAVIASYYVLRFKRNFWRQKSLYIVMVMFLAGFILYYFVVGTQLSMSTKMLGGTLGETRSPSLWETLSNPEFMQIRLYNALYGWWYMLYQSSPFMFITAAAGLLMNVKQWRKLSILCLFPLCGVSFYSLAIRVQPQPRFVVQVTPILIILSAAFIVELSRLFLAKGGPILKRHGKVNLKQTLLVLVFLEIIFMSFIPHYLLINNAQRNLKLVYDHEMKLSRWIRVNTSPNSIIMTNNYIAVSYYTDRETVSIPRPIGGVGVDMSMILLLVRRFNVDYLILDRGVRSIPDLREIREDPLNAPLGFVLVYWDENPVAVDPRVLIYDVGALHS